MSSDVVSQEAIDRLFGNPKDVQLVSVNGQPVVPVGQPVYKSPWPIERVHEEFRKQKMAYLDEQETVDLMLQMKGEFDTLLSAALYVIWSTDNAGYYNFITRFAKKE